MGKDKKYWLPVLSWNLIDSMTTESISPHDFYMKRHFGNDVSRFIDNKNERSQYLLLYKQQPDSDYAIEIKRESLDEALVEQHKEYVLYPKTIYFRHGSVKFIFKSQELLDRFLADTSILLEVKGVTQFLDDFIVGTGEKKSITYQVPNKLSFTEEEHIIEDDKLNACRGALTGYIQGETVVSDPRQQELLLKVITFNNEMAGLNTELMVNDSLIPEEERYLAELRECKEEYVRMQMKETYSFELIGNLVKEVVKLSKNRSDEMNSMDSSRQDKRLSEKQCEEKEVQHELEELKIEEDICISELNEIKKAERENGIALGMKLKFFKKGSKEKERKDYLTSHINDIKLNRKIIRKHLKEIKEEIASLQQEIYGYSPILKYNPAIESTFATMSTSLDNLVSAIRAHTIEKSVDFTALEIKGYNIELAEKNSNADVFCFNKLLSYLLYADGFKKRIIPDGYILDLIVKVGKELASNYDLEGKEEVLSSLRTLWLYKSHRTSSLVIPKDSEIMQAVFSFLLKYQGFEQIDRYMMNKHFKRKSLAFLLWGACIGYAAMPKTFTDNLPIGTEDLIMDKM